jgi:dolichol-phosphate mannosyltransferase
MRYFDMPASTLQSAIEGTCQPSVGGAAAPVFLSVVVPVHNERENVAPQIAEIVAALTGVLPFEIVYVNDGSDDGTAQALLLMQHDCSVLRIITHDISAGQSTAIRTGVRAARGEWIATLDGDGQNDPLDIVPLLTEACTRAAARGDRRVLVNGWRKQREDSLFRRLQSRIANGVRRRLLHDGTPDTGCGLKVFSRDIYLVLPYFDHMHRFLPALTQREGGDVLSLPVRHRPRLHGVSHYGALNRMWAGVVDVAGMLWLSRRARVPRVVEAAPSVNAGGQP